MHYNLEQENKTLIICIDLQERGPKRLYYRDTLLEQAKGKDLEAVKCLIQEELRASRLSPLSSQANTHPFNKIRIPWNRSLEVLKLLGSTGNLLWKGKKLFVDPFSRLELSFEVDELVKGVVSVGTKSWALSCCEAIFPGNPPFMIRDNTLQWFVSDAQWNLLQYAFPEPQLLTTWIEEDLKEYPKVQWKKGSEPKVPQEPMPFLVLQDRTGAFADLWFDYGALGKLAAHDPSTVSWRQSTAEKNWEKDLLETDYLQKIVGTSHYYCPMDKVAKSLTFLLEIGWPIYEPQGKRVMRQSQCDLVLENQGDRILIKGKILYEHHEANLHDVIGSFNRKEKFIDLSKDTVGLLDPLPVIQDLAEEEWVAEGVCIKKSRFAILEEHFSAKELIPILGTASFTPPSGAFQGILYPYQQEGVDWLEFLRRSSFHGLLADAMGLGKTVQTIAFFSQLSQAAPLLIIAPTSLLFNWRKELEKFLPHMKVYVHSGPDRIQEVEILKEKQIILTSYALLRLDSALLTSLDYECIVLDEAQAIKNPDSLVAKSAYQLQAKMRLAITGTPIENTSEDLWSLFHFLMPELLGERPEFQAKLKTIEVDHRYLKQLKKQLHPFILRRTKEVIQDQLPEKIEQIVWVDMEESQKQFYEDWLAKARTGILKKVAIDGLGAHRFEVLEMILRLRQICCHPLLLQEEIRSAKFERLLEDLEVVIEEKRKVLVYSQFVSMLKLIAKALSDRGWKYAILDGSTQNRENNVSEFQDDSSLSIFLMSLKAGGVGLNLTAADYVFIYDPWWNIAAENQAIDRAHRLGRKDTVIAKRYVTAWSIEEKMMRLKEIKKNLFDKFLDFDTATSDVCFDEIIKDLL